MGLSMFCSSGDIPDLVLELVPALLCLLSYTKENYLLACMQNQANTSLLLVHEGVSTNGRGCLTEENNSGFE